MTTKKLFFFSPIENAPVTNEYESLNKREYYSILKKATLINWRVVWNKKKRKDKQMKWKLEIQNRQTMMIKPDHGNNS